MTYEEVLSMVEKLPVTEKARLLEDVSALLRRELSENETPQQSKPKRSLYGIWKDTSISAEEIDEARREMWGNFPREDI